RRNCGEPGGVRDIEDDQVSGPPGSTTIVEGIRDRDRSAAGEGHLLQLVGGGETDPLPVGGEEWIYGSLGPADWLALKLAEFPEVELPTAIRGGAGVHQALAVRRDGQR